MPSLQDARMKLRSELEAPPALRAFGSGWISGVLGFVLGLAGFFLVLSLRAPGAFAMPETRAFESSGWFRLGLHFLLIVAFLLSALSLTLRPGKMLGGCGMALTLLAALLGGSKSTATVPDATPLFFGLDWFVLNVLLTGLLFIPFERLFPRRTEQEIFREEWREDLFYYFVSSMMVQALTFLTFAPAKSILAIGQFTGDPGVGGQFAVFGPVCGDHVLDRSGAVLGASGVSSRAVVVEVSCGASFGAEHGLDGGGADAFYRDFLSARGDGDPDVCARLQ
jgi:hypothetical protein